MNHSPSRILLDYYDDEQAVRDLVERAREQGYTLEEIAEDTNRFDDLQSLVEEQQGQPTAGDATDD